MSVGNWLGRIAGWSVRHAKLVLVVAAGMAAVAAIAATQLPTDAGPGTLVDSDTGSFRATEGVREAFGEEPVVVLAEGDLPELVLTGNLARLLRLEGCLSGKAPEGKSIPGPCSELARFEPVESVIGPATFLNEAAIQVDRQLRRLVKRVPPNELREVLLGIAARYGITSAPTLSNPDFVAAVVFDLERPRGTPKARLSYLFPNSRSAQILVRLKPALSEAERRRALELIRAAVFDPTPRRACRFRGEPEPCFALDGGRYVVSGVPVVVEGVAAALEDALLVLLGVAVAAMALTLLLVFRSRFRLLPLGLALLAAALTFGLLDLLGGSLTMASIAVLPILIGLAVDYAIQFQARFDEAVGDGLAGPEATRAAAARGGPTIAIAVLATAAGFLALQLSPTPMVREFGWLLILGIAIAFLLSLTVGFAALSLRPAAGARGAPAARGVLFFAQTSWRERARARRKTQRAEGHPSLPPMLDRALGVANDHPRRVLGIGLALAVLGWGLSTQIDTVSDIRALGPQDAPAIRDLNELQAATGVSGQLDVRVRADDLTDPATLRWMGRFKQRALEAGGFSGTNPSCLDADLCPGPALSDFLASADRVLTQRQIRATFAQIPVYDLEKLAEVDPETGLPAGTALLSFGIRAQSLDDQQDLVERVRAEIGKPGEPGGPPDGVEVQLAGLPVIASAAADDLSASRYTLALAGLLAVALVLLVAYRAPRRALLPLVPIVLATGWGSLLLWASGVPLNPMSAALGALTIAIATEFAVLLAARFHEERDGGRTVADALGAAYRRTGLAVLASGVTATVGFAVLLASDVRMLRDFGFVTVTELGAALLGVIVALPAALTLAERRRGSR